MEAIDDRKSAPAAGTLRPEEEWARSAMSHAVGAPVEQHDDGSEPGMYDLDVLYGDRPNGAVEVTSAADGDSIALWKLMNGPDERWQVPTLVGGWMVSLSLAARGKRIRAELPALLLTLEQAEMPELWTGRGRTSDALEAIADDLGIVHARQSGTDFPGSIYITIDLPLEQSGGQVHETGDALADWVGDFLADPAQEDVLRKLARSGASERHAFVILPGFCTAPFGVIDLLMRDGAPVPTVDPRLPAEVTAVWIASTWSSGDGFRWSPEGDWTRFQKFPD